MAAPVEVPIRAEPNGVNGEDSASSTSQIPPITNGVVHESEMNGTATAPGGLSSDEMALYDRQIRLWGAQAQERIRSAHILLVSLRALGTEIAKNLTLAGVSSLTLIDNEPVTEEDLGPCFFLREEDVGKPRAEAARPRIQELNPRVSVRVDGGLQDLLAKDQTYYQPFSCVIACDHDILTLSLINTAANMASRPFYAAGVHGFFGYIFADLIAHEFVVEREKSNIPTTITAETLTRAVVSVTDKKEANSKTTEIVKKQELYCPLILANSSPLPLDVMSNRRKLKAVPALLPCLRALFEFQRDYGHLPGHQQQELAVFTQLAQQKSRELLLPPETLDANFLRTFIQNIGSDFQPVAAFVGGRLSEDVINVLGKREQPIQNFALFDGEALEGRIYCLYSPPPNLAMGFPGLDPSMGGLPSIDMSAGMSGLNGMQMPVMPTDMQTDQTMGQGQAAQEQTGQQDALQNGQQGPPQGQPQDPNPDGSLNLE